MKAAEPTRPSACLMIETCTTDSSVLLKKIVPGTDEQLIVEVYIMKKSTGKSAISVLVFLLVAFNGIFMSVNDIFMLITPCSGASGIAHP